MYIMKIVVTSGKSKKKKIISRTRASVVALIAALYILLVITIH